MIIRMTVGDNDFNTFMKMFIRRFPLGITSIPDELGLEESLQLLEKMNYIDRILNPNTTKSLSEQDKQLIIEQIKIAFSRMVNKCEPNDAEYLIRHFEVEIMDSIEDKWENGEAWYWFQNSGAYLNQ